MLTANRRLTLADLLALPDDDGDDQIYDLLEGELVARNAPNLSHGAVLSELTLLLGDAQRRGYGQFFSGPHAVALDFPQHGMAARDVSHPDLVFIRAGREELWLGKRVIEGVPDLIIEVRSRSTAGAHPPGGQHWDAYERNRVPHYWIADPRSHLIELHALGVGASAVGRYGEAVILRAGDALVLPGFPDISEPVAHVFQNAVDEEDA